MNRPSARIVLHAGPVWATVAVLAVTARASDVGRENSGEIELVDFNVKLDVVLQRDEEDWIWFHPRAAAIPDPLGRGGPTVVMTIQKHLGVSDYYSGVYVMRTDDGGKSWTGPQLFPQLDWWKESEEVRVSVCDVTPGWHAQSGKLIAIGTKIRYDREGRQLHDEPHSRETAYAVYDPKSDQWTRWQTLQLPEAETKFFLSGAGCVQWVVDQSGAVLVPIYYKARGQSCYSATVVQCKFDGETLAYVRHGDELHLDVPRGFCEPSLVESQGHYYLTLRNDEKGYVTASDDGLHFAPVKPWAFDDGAELGSYNTQQHWVGHANGLFLVYTRRGANNDHVMRHRAPLFIAQVDPQRLYVIRKTERVLIPEHGAPMGNFGAAKISETESWVTVSEFMWPAWNETARKKGAAGRTFVARIIWAPQGREDRREATGDSAEGRASTASPRPLTPYP